MMRRKCRKPRAETIADIGTPVALFIQDREFQGHKSMPHEPTLPKLIREAEQARMEEAVVAEKVGEILDHTRAVAQTITRRVCQLTHASADRPNHAIS